MSDKQDFELPLPSEKLSHKFILDSLREERVDRAQREIPIAAETTTITLDEQFPKERIQKKSFNLPEGKKYFRIGEAAELIGVEPYVLRYWETEFKTVKPTKSKTGHRVYSRNNVELLLQIKHLLHEERFSIKGAKQKLVEQKRESKELKIEPSPDKRVIKEIQQDLKELLALAKLSI